MSSRAGRESAEDATHGASVTSRALAVLAAFEGTDGSLAVASISQRAGLPLSTTYRLINELEAWGALRRGSDGKFQIGMRLWEIGQLAGRRLRDRAHPHLQDLFDLTHENVHLAIRDGLHALYVDKVYGSRRVTVASRIGGRVPLHSTAVGRVLLAAQADWFVEAYLAKELDSPSPYTITDPDELFRIIQAVRADGYAVTVEQMRVGALSIAVPIHFEDQVVASVAIVFEATRTNEIPRHIPLLKGTAERIEAAMVGVPMRWSRPARTP